MPKPALTFTDFRSGAHGFDRIWIGCSTEAARYHVWLNTQTLEPDTGEVYKNPPHGVQHGDPGDFRTRTLHATRGEGKAVVGALLPHAARLVAAAREEEANKEAAVARMREEVRRNERMRDAAPALLGALEEIMSTVAGCERDPHWERARAAIALAKGR